MSVGRIISTVGGPGTESDIVRIAVVNSVSSHEASNRSQNYLIQLSRSVSLNEVVRDLCKHWGITGATEDFSLKFERTDEFVTEDSKSSLKDGTILKLCPSAKVQAQDIITKMRSDDEGLCQKGCSALQLASFDFFVVKPFIDFGGLTTLISFLQEPKFSGSGQQRCEGALLGALVEILKHEETPLTWDDDAFDERFVSKICVNLTHRIETELLRNSLSVLFNLSQSVKNELVQKSISAQNLLQLLTLSDDAQVHNLVFSLYNSLFAVSSQEKKSSMHTVVEQLKVRQWILTNVMTKQQSEEMKRQLFIFQRNLLYEESILMMTPVDDQDQRALEKIKELRRLAFHLEIPKGNTQRGRFMEGYKALGFVNTRDSIKDFHSTPPGMLALDLMLNYAQRKPDAFIKMTVENSYRLGDANHACPFAAASIALTSLLCSALHLTEMDLDSIEADVQPMLFAEEKPVDALFSVMIEHLFKTWGEMRATTEDFDKVMEVTKEQLISGFKISVQTIQEFSQGLKSYSQVCDSWKEAAKLKGEQESKAVKELEQILLPDIINLVQRQRLGFIVEGSKFLKLRGTGTSKHLYVRLSPNHKSLYYGDWNDDSVPTLDNLANKISVSDIKELVVGAELLAGRDVRRHRDNATHLAMSIVADTGSVDLLAPDQGTFDYWSDAINTLLRRDMTSSKAKADIDLFLSMEMKIRLLDVEGIELPKEAPIIPPLPPPLVSRHRQ